MKRYFLSLIMVLGLGMSAQAQLGTINISGKVSNCPQDSLLLFLLDGSMLRPMAKFPLQDGGVDEAGQHKVFNVNIQSNIPEGFYLIGDGQPPNTRMLILGNDPVVQMIGQCPSLGKAQIAASADNAILDQALTQNQIFQKDFTNLINKYRIATRKKQDLSGLDSAMAQLDIAKQNLFRDTKAQSPFAAKVLALFTYLSYQSFGLEDQDEASYFATQNFRLVDFSDPVYERIPQVKDAMQTYARSVGKVGLSFDEIKKAIEDIVAPMKKPGIAHKTALMGLVAGFMMSNEDAYLYYVDEYVSIYGAENPALTQNYQSTSAPIRVRALGAQAPEISLPNVEGDTLNLSDLKGKIVLVDFWASWCGPCRKENPNVRQVYSRYKDKGFEIIGVSLDRDRSRWKQAIEQDQLPWLHVSDLRQWKSVAAKTYGVRSIPFTVLLDENGKIIAKGLRGKKLEAKLEELLGES